MLGHEAIAALGEAPHLDLEVPGRRLRAQLAEVIAGVLVAGGATAGVRGGRHLRFAEPTPMANLHLTLLEKAGVRMDKFADSDGTIGELTAI